MIIPVETLLAWGATYKKLDPDETIFREGVECHFYHQLVSGSVRWISITDEGREFIQSMIEPGEPFGELPLFDEQPYAATAIANKESVVLRLHKNTFRELLKEEPELHFTEYTFSPASALAVSRVGLTSTLLNLPSPRLGS